MCLVGVYPRSVSDDHIGPRRLPDGSDRIARLYIERISSFASLLGFTDSVACKSFPLEGVVALAIKLLMGVFLFCSGIAAGITLCRYASPVWSYNESIGIREDLVNASIARYREGRVAEAAILMKGANGVAARPDMTWPLMFPWHAAVLRVTGVFADIHVSRDYRAAETAYLFHVAGLEELSRPYYERLETQRGRNQAQIDASAAAFIREAALFQEREKAK